jgi:hypothetical protein
MAALREVDDNQPQEHAGDDDVDRHPGIEAEQVRASLDATWTWNGTTWTTPAGATSLPAGR